MEIGFQVSLFSDRWTSFLASPLSVGSPVRAQLYRVSDPNVPVCRTKVWSPTFSSGY